MFSADLPKILYRHPASDFSIHESRLSLRESSEYAGPTFVNASEWWAGATLVPPYETGRAEDVNPLIDRV